MGIQRCCWTWSPDCLVIAGDIQTGLSIGRCGNESMYFLLHEIKIYRRMTSLSQSTPSDPFTSSCFIQIKSQGYCVLSSETRDDGIDEAMLCNRKAKMYPGSYVPLSRHRSTSRYYAMKSATINAQVMMCPILTTSRCEASPSATVGTVGRLRLPVGSMLPVLLMD